MPRHAINLGAAWDPPTAETPRWTRRFGRPAGVEAGDRLLLVCRVVQTSDAWRRASLNGVPLDWRDVGGGELECDVTSLIGDRNALVLQSPPVGAASGMRADAVDGGRTPLPEAWGVPALVIVSD